MTKNFKPEIISFYHFFQQFPDEKTARKYFEEKRWHNIPYCGHCGSENVFECKDHKPMPYRCRDCRQHFSVRTDTVLAESRLPLHKWLMAIYMMTTARKGIPSTQMAKQLGITQKTAWFLSQRIREIWLGSDDADMGNHVQVDECYVGGKEANKHASKKLHSGRGATGKTPVIGARGESGYIIAHPIQNTKRDTLQTFISNKVQKGSTIVTDNFPAYRILHDYKHVTVNHSVGEYIKNKAHTNGIESFWALLKRGYYGIYHHMSVKHLHRYVNEFAFRHNTSKVNTMDFINMTIAKIDNKRLIYKDLINA